MPFLKAVFKETAIEFTRVCRLRDFAIAARIVADDPSFEKGNRRDQGNVPLKKGGDPDAYIV